MKNWTLVVLLSAGCSNHPVPPVMDAGPMDAGPMTTAIDVCGRDAGGYAGFLDLSRTELEDLYPTLHRAFLFGVGARFFDTRQPYSRAPWQSRPAMFCSGTPVVGECCVVPFPGDQDAGTAAARVGPEYVSCVDEQTGNTGSGVGMTDPWGGVTCSVWSGGHSLRCTADGGIGGSFVASISTPLDVAGLSDTLFLLDGGTVTISRTQDLLVTWTAGSPSAAVAINVVGATSAVACLAADTGSFSVPSALVGQLASGDRGAITVHRFTASCVQTASAQVSVLVENGVRQSAVYP